MSGDKYLKECKNLRENLQQEEAEVDGCLNTIFDVLKKVFKRKILGEIEDTNRRDDYRALDSKQSVKFFGPKR